MKSFLRYHAKEYILINEALLTSFPLYFVVNMQRSEITIIDVIIVLHWRRIPSSRRSDGNTLHTRLQVYRAHVIPGVS